MANTIVYTKNVVALSAIPVVTITFTAGITSNNTLVLRDGSITGPIFLTVIHAANAFDTFLIGGAVISPVMVVADCTFTSGATWSFLYGRN
jgi:hypothetical protein